MSTILIIVLLILLLGGGGGYYGYNRYGGAGLGGALGLVLIILLVFGFLAVCVSKAADLDACVGRCVDFFTIRGSGWYGGLSAPSELARSAPETAVEQRL
jgi:hypothetical protein